jgi:hypothetical protein
MFDFIQGKDYTREDIHAQCGGNKQSFLPAKNGKIVAACLRPDLNPQAPDVIVVNTSASARAAGRMLAHQQEAIPVFIEQQVDRLRYVGDYRVAESLTVPTECAPYARDTGFKPHQVSRVLKLQRC